MAPLTKNLFYQNTNKYIEKLSDILLDVLNEKSIDHRFELQSSIGGIAK